MTLLLTLLILAVVGLVAAVAAGRVTGGLDEPSSSLPGRGLPPGRVGVADLEQVRLSPALRGYRMDEVDDVLDRLTEELRRRDGELAALRGEVPLPDERGLAWGSGAPDGDHAVPHDDRDATDPFARPVEATRHAADGAAGTVETAGTAAAAEAGETVRTVDAVDERRGGS